MRDLFEFAKAVVCGFVGAICVFFVLPFYVFWVALEFAVKQGIKKFQESTRKFKKYARPRAKILTKR